MSKSATLKGKNVFIRTVTLYFVGHVEAVTKSWIILSSAAWIPDTGRFGAAMRSGQFSEVEPYPDDVIVRVNREGLIDISIWDHKLPRSEK